MQLWKCKPCKEVIDIPYEEEPGPCKKCGEPLQKFWIMYCSICGRDKTDFFTQEQLENGFVCEYCILSKEHGVKVARNSLDRFMEEAPHYCMKDWPEKCFCQCGQDISKKFSFFEAFPKSPDTFIRGTGKSIDEAEESAWKKWGKILACEKHEFHRKGYTNGAGFCKHCDLFISKYYPPIEEPKKEQELMKNDV